MKRNAPFIKNLALALAVVILRTSLAGAAPIVPGRLAVLEPPLTLPEMRAAWDSIRKEVYLDPLLLVRGREEVMKVLDDWRLEARSVLSARESADRIALDRAVKILARAWALFYQFDFSGAARVLGEGEKALDAPGDGGFRAHILFEIQILKGIVSRASGGKGYVEDFQRAAALEPSRELPPERYSPEIISAYDGIRNEFLGGKLVPVSLNGSPEDAGVRLDGQDLGKIRQNPEIGVFPGKHFIEIRAPGYEPRDMAIDIRRSEPFGVRYELIPLGPGDPPDSFFLERLRAGDRAYVMLLADRLKVEYLLIPDPEGTVLNVWLLDREGRSVNRTSLWKAGDSVQSAVFKADGLLAPIRHQWAYERTTGMSPLNLPAPEPGFPGIDDSGKTLASWKKYALALGIILLVGAAGGSNGGGTKIEATW